MIDRNEDGSPYEPDPIWPECGSCGKRVPYLETCSWDSRLQVGPCCQETNPQEVVCEWLIWAFSLAERVSDLAKIVAIHDRVCPLCVHPEVEEKRAA